MADRYPRRRVLDRSRFNQVSHAPYGLTLECGHVIGSRMSRGKTAGCRQCYEAAKRTAPTVKASQEKT